MSGSEPLRFLCAGMGGYAWAVIQDLLARGAINNIKLVGACDPGMDQMHDQVARLRDAEAGVYANLEQMLASAPADAIWLPVPIHLHRSFTEQSLRAGLHVITEKPAAGSVQDVDAMIAARDQAQKQVLVGFQDIYSTYAGPAKAELLAGSIGKIEDATVHAAWPRGSAYYRRNNWAGKLRVAGQWVLDSPLQNAISHYVHLALFLLGNQPHDSGVAEQIDAELYRANDIENFDTCAFRVTLHTGVSLFVFLTHTVDQQHDAVISIRGSEGSLTVDAQGCRIEGNRSCVWVLDANKRTSMVRTIAQQLRTQPRESAVATLEMARSHTLVVNAASQATPVHRISPRFISVVKESKGNDMTIVPGMSEVMTRCVRSRRLPSELGDIPWARPGGILNLQGYRQFAGPHIGH